MKIVKQESRWCIDQKGKMTGDSSELKIKIKTILNLFIDRYFNGESWKTRKEPYIFFKHLFRKFLYEKGLTSTVIAKLERKFIYESTTGHASILNSKNKNNLPLHPVLKEDIHKFLNKNWELPLQQRVKKQVIYNLHDKGYEQDELSNKCLIHEQVIHNLLNNKKVPYHILKQMEQEL